MTDRSWSAQYIPTSMKRLLLSLLFTFAVLHLPAISYEDARREAWFLTDKMAYELNLTPEQYNCAYEVNLDYFMNLRSSSDCYGAYWEYRNIDLRSILFDWQYSLYRTLDYFYRPIRWVRLRWYYPVREHYRRSYYYFARPDIYLTYRGGHRPRRTRRDTSPYWGMRFSRGNGMRDSYRSGHMPNPAPRPGRDYPGRPGDRDNRWEPDFDDKQNNRTPGSHNDRNNRRPDFGNRNDSNRKNDSSNRNRNTRRPSFGQERSVNRSNGTRAQGQNGNRSENARTNTRPARNFGR